MDLILASIVWRVLGGKIILVFGARQVLEVDLIFFLIMFFTLTLTHSNL